MGALDGRAALERALCDNYDVLVLDRDLPGMSGDDICRSVTSDGLPVRVLLLTAAVGERERDDARHKLSDAERSDRNKVRGCASQVWLVTEELGDGRLGFRGDSDAHMVRGLIAILLRLYSGHAKAEIAAFDAKAALKRLGLDSMLSAQRSNGLASMVERIRRDAAAPAAV